MNRKPKPPKENLVGQIFGYLEVIKMEQTAKSISGEYRCICKCHLCGKENVEVGKWALKRGQTTSCGCRKDQYKKITGKNSKQFTGYMDISGKTWTTIQNRAKKRNIPFNITIEDAWSVYQKQNGKCALTGIELVFGPSSKPIETTASLDRIDSNKGYVIDNIQWVHKDINIMKNIFDQNYFISMCFLVFTLRKDDINHDQLSSWGRNKAMFGSRHNRTYSK